MSEMFVAGNWHQLSKGDLYIGGQWRTLTRGELYIGGAWKQVLSFIPPLSLSVSPSDVSGLGSSNKPLRITSDPVMATPTGGKAPFTYAWAITSGTATAATPTNATTTFSEVVSPGGSKSSTARVTVTDSLAKTAIADVSITLENGGL